MIKSFLILLNIIDLTISWNTGIFNIFQILLYGDIFVTIKDPLDNINSSKLPTGRKSVILPKNE